MKKLLLVLLVACSTSPVTNESQALTDDSPRGHFLRKLADAIAATDRTSGEIPVQDLAAISSKDDPIGSAITQQIVDLVRFDHQLQSRELPVMQDALDALWPKPADVQALMANLTTIEVRETVAPASLTLDVDLSDINAASFPARAALTFADALPAGESALAIDPARLRITGVEADGVPLAAWRVSNGRLLFRADNARRVVIDYALVPQLIATDDDWQTATGLIVDRRDPAAVQVASLLWPYFQGRLYPANPSMSAALVATVNVKGTLQSVATHTAWPIPGYDVAIAASNTFKRLEGPKQLSLYADAHRPAQSDDANVQALADAAKTIEVVEQLLAAPYPDAAIDFVQAPGPFGGMEHQGQPSMNMALLVADAPYIPGVIASTLAHEAIHAYFGNGVRIAGPADFSVSEGFVHYLERRGNEVFGHGALVENLVMDRGVLAMTMQRVAHPQLVSSAFEDIKERDLTVPYMLGAGILRMIETQLGREVFDPLLAEFYHQQVGKPTSIAQWASFLTAKTGHDYVDFYKQWGERTSLPVYEVETVTQGKTVAFNLYGLSSSTPFFDDVTLPVRVEGKNGESKTVVANLGKIDQPIDVGFEVARGVIDPDATWLIVFEYRAPSPAPGR